MKRLMIIVVALFSLAFCQYELNEPGDNFVIIIDTLSLLLLLLTAYFSWELYKLMRGGQLSQSWGFIAIGIVTLAFSKIIEVGTLAQMWEIQRWFPSTINLVVALLWMVGIFSQRKNLM